MLSSLNISDFAGRLAAAEVPPGGEARQLSVV